MTVGGVSSDPKLAARVSREILLINAELGLDSEKQLFQKLFLLRASIKSWLAVNLPNVFLFMSKLIGRR